MKKIWDRLNEKMKTNNKMLLFIVGIMLMGIIFGSFLVVILKETDKALINQYIDAFINNINTNKLDYKTGLFNSLISNIFFVIVIWLLGLSAIGLPITILMFFYKSFSIGFTIGSMIMKYKIKGSLLALIYLFPHQFINLIIYVILVLYSLTISLKIIKSVIKKETIDFKLIISKYQKILFISIIVVSIMSFIEIFITPIFIKMIVGFLQ